MEIRGSAIVVTGGASGPFAPDADWFRSWNVNLMSHVHAARAVLPSMLERGTGYLLNTASAAGLLTDMGACAYSVSKHAAVGFAEWLAIAYADAGSRVSCLCPQGVRTPMLAGAAEQSGGGAHLTASAIAPEAVADAVVAGLAAETFLILPHPEVRGYVQRKAADPDRWLAGIRRPAQAPVAPGGEVGLSRLWVANGSGGGGRQSRGTPRIRSRSDLQAARAER